MKMIVSNLRLPKNEWQRIKIMAAERDLSINSYIRLVVKTYGVKMPLNSLPFSTTKSSSYPIWTISKLAKKKRQAKGLSKQDKIIYGYK